MKKFLLVLSILLTGCFHETWNDKPAAPPEPAPPVIIALGTDGIVSWRCELETLNESLVWVKCDFHNGKPVTESACIKVGFYDNATGKPVEESRRFCSGVLLPNDNSTQYAAFIKEKRVGLRRCGELLDLCVMLAGPSDEMRLLP